MAKFTPITLTAVLNTMSGSSLYGESDGTGLQSQFKTYDIDLSAIVAQSHSDASTREPLLYNGLDIEAGMFIADDGGQTILKINSISAKSEGGLTCLCEDVDMESYRLTGINTIASNAGVVIFGLNIEGEPIIVGTPFQAGAVDKIQSRFSLNERDDRVKFTHLDAPAVNKGDIVTIDSNGDLLKFGTVGASEIKVGIVVDKIKNGKDVYVKPFNDIIRDYSDPEILNGTASDVYYTDELVAGSVTTTVGGKAAFLQLNNSIATTQSITSVTQPGSGDIITINGITIFDGPNGDTVADAAAFSSLINTFTGDTNVTSAITQDPGQVNAEGNTLAYSSTWANHDVFIPIGQQGQSPASYAEITIGDGVNAPQSIIFDTPDQVVNFGTNYDIMSPTAILAEFQAAIIAGGLFLNAELYNSTDHIGQAIQITTTSSATGIFLTNVGVDAFNGNVVGPGSSTGIGLTASLGAPTLTLTRASGGNIDIDGTPLSGGYLNQSGVVSSNSGRVPYLLLIESEGGGGVDIDGVDSNIDQDLTPTVTNGNFASTGITITHTPWNDGRVEVSVNGMGVNVGDGIKSKDCYFSVDGGITARLMIDIKANDELFWNSITAGYILDGGDGVDINYQAASDDIENYVAPSPSPSPVGPPSPISPSPSPSPSPVGPPSPISPSPSPSPTPAPSPGAAPSPLGPGGA